MRVWKWELGFLKVVKCAAVNTYVLDRDVNCVNIRSIPLLSKVARPLQWVLYTEKIHFWGEMNSWWSCSSEYMGVSEGRFDHDETLVCAGKFADLNYSAVTLAALPLPQMLPCSHNSPTKLHGCHWGGISSCR